MNDHQLLNYFDRHGLPQTAREYIAAVRDSEPARRVGTHARQNVVTRFYSEKMGRHIAAESHTVELSFIRRCEYDDDVLEYFDQPQPLEIAKIDKNGVRRRTQYTPDFLVLRRTGPEIVETKDLRTIEKLVVKESSNWAKRNGKYEHEPAVVAFRSIGLEHIVHAYQNEDAVLSANLDLILQAPSELTPEGSRTASRVISELTECACLSVSELAVALELQELTVVCSLLKNKVIFANIQQQLLTEQSQARISLDPALVGTDLGVDLDTVGAISEEIMPSYRAAKTALARLKILEEQPETKQARRLRAKIREGTKRGLSQFQSLLPRNHLKGNRASRLDDAVVDFLNEYLKTKYADPRGLQVAVAHREYSYLAKQNHPRFAPVCRKTFQRYLDNFDKTMIAKGRLGRRGGNSAAAPTPLEARSIRAVAPFMLGSMDHYNADLHLAVGKVGNKEFTARCWATVLIDVFSERLLGRYFSLDKPSRVACAMVIRDCIRRNGRLPGCIGTDRAKEHESVYFESMLAHYGVSLSIRPPEQSKFGAEIERLFLAFKQEYLALLPGFITDIAYNRGRSRTHAPAAHAVVRPVDLIKHFDLYMERRQDSIVGANVESANEAFERQLTQFPFVGQRIKFDLATRIATAVDHRRYRVDPRRGIHATSGLHYWNPKLQSLRAGAAVDVRLEPEDPFRIYARVNNEWIICRASRDREFCQKSKPDQEAIALLFNKPPAMKAAIRQHSQESLIASQSSLLEQQQEDHTLIGFEFVENENVPDADSHEASELYKPIEVIEIGEWR